MVSFPPCKINLGLSILRKRADGFHDIETCFYPVPFTDILEIIPAKTFAFSTSGRAIPAEPSENLCVKAYTLLREDFDVEPATIHLHKIIPAGAGLGGGSSDAAHCLRLLDRIFDLHLTIDQLREYAARLGSDCAFFITDGPMVGTGRGEILSPVDVSLTGKYLVLVNPEIHVSTREAFAAITPSLPEKKTADVLAAPVINWQDHLKNDFEESVFTRYPLVGRLKDSLYEQGAVFASMSGSGSTVFGIFNENPKTVSIKKEWVIWSGMLP